MVGHENYIYRCKYEIKATTNNCVVFSFTDFSLSDKQLSVKNY